MRYDLTARRTSGWQAVQLPKLHMRVRFPSPAPEFAKGLTDRRRQTPAYLSPSIARTVLMSQDDGAET